MLMTAPTFSLDSDGLDQNIMPFELVGEQPNNMITLDKYFAGRKKDQPLVNPGIDTFADNSRYYTNLLSQ